MRDDPACYVLSEAGRDLARLPDAEFHRLATATIRAIQTTRMAPSIAVLARR